MDDRVGYDFSFVDEKGLFGGPKGCRYLIEAKGILTLRNAVHLSSKEWRVAQDAHNRKDGLAVYIVVVVLLQKNPSILYWIEDPVYLLNNGVLSLIPNEYILRVENFKQECH